VLNKKVEKTECTALISKRDILKEKLLPASIKLFIAIILLIIATYSWFLNNNNVAVNELTVTVPSVSQVEISTDDGLTWKKIASLNIADDCALYKESTSNGIDFYKPALPVGDDTSTKFIPSVKGEDYLEYKVLFRSALPITIYLEKKSDVYPAAGRNTADLINSSHVIRASSYGNFSRDLIAGALRLAFIGNELVDGNFIEQPAPKYIWAPNKGFQVKLVNDVYLGYLDSTDLQDYKYTKVIATDNFHLENLPNLVETINASFDTSITGNDIPLLTIDNTSEIAEENVEALTIRIWVEGNDREAIHSLKGGQFKINLSFLCLS